MKKFFFSGGLGNQLFQLGAYLDIREKYSALVPDLSVLNYPLKNETRRSFELLEFLPEISKGSLFVRYSLEVAKRLELSVLSFDKTEPEATWYYGYFQRRKYAEIARQFLLNKKIGSRKFDAGIPAFHLRLGDFITNDKASKVSGFVGDDYIDSALERLGGEGQIHVFSDQPRLAKEILSRNKRYEFVYQNESKLTNPWDDILALSQYSTVICSNSTFSFWGAYLGKEKKVIAPSRWFVNGEPNPEYLPEEWTYI
jgi:hypothetical protein